KVLILNGFTVSRATVFRDLKTLQEEFHAPIDTDIETGGYFYTQPTFRLPALITNENKLKAAKLICNLLETVKGTPLYEEAFDIFDTLSELVPNVVEGQRVSETDLKDDVQNRVIFLGPPNVDIKPDTWRTIYGAIQKNQIIKFNYKAFGKSTYTLRAAQPWQLIFDNGNWNLYAFDYKSKERRLFSLSEMRDLELNDKDKKFEFTLPKDYDFRLITNGAFGCYREDKSYHFKLHLQGYAARYARNRIWGNNQKIQVDEENPGPQKDGILLSFDSNQFQPILRWTWSWAEDAYPLEPQELVDSWEQHLKNLNAQAQSKRN
ncbi:MAG: WYL domain-containing protein, partial [Treponema sp.]|nr:WYL domain-containing protein [Treponema sp.]